MKAGKIFHDSLQITMRVRQLWILTLILYVLLLPALVISAGLGIVTSYVLNPLKSIFVLPWLEPIREIPAGRCVLYATLTWVVLVATSLLSWAVQAAMIRAADAATAGNPVSIRESLRLGSRRWRSLIKLALTFGLIMQALAVLPTVLALILEKTGVLGFGLLQLVESVSSPLSIVLGIVVFLFTLSVALEDLRPQAAGRRVWELVRSGWWGFLLAYLVQFLMAMALSFLFAAILTVAVFLFLLSWFNKSSTEAFLGGAICVVSSPVGIGMLTFILVFSTVFFTQIYRAAAELD
jgi:hypothetical protein